MLVIASALSGFIPTQTTPEIDEFLLGEDAGPLVRLVESEAVAPLLLLALAMLAFLGIYIVALVGLLLLKPWARKLYVLSFVLAAGFYPLMGTTLSDPFSATIDHLWAACTGAILATLYLSDVRTIFGSRGPAIPLPQTVSAPASAGVDQLTR